MHTRSILPAAVLLAIPSLASAQEQRAQLDPILVTPTRTAETVDETLASVTVIDREEIERLQPKSFTDLLRGRAGLATSQNGPFGKTASLHTRGTDSGHTLLLVDGVRMGSATLGSPSWQFLPISEIERVEVVRGPRTSLYGSDAIGGVVQVFTREGDGPPRARAHLGTGSFGTREFGAGVSGAQGETRYSLSGSHFQTDGIDIQEDTGDRGEDGYDNSSFSGRVSHRLAGGAELFGSFLYSTGETEIDEGTGEFRDWTDYGHHAVRAGIRGPVTDHWRSRLSLAHSRDEAETYYDGAFDSLIDTRRDLVAWQNDVLLGNHLLTLGADYREDRVESSNDYAQTRRDNWGLFAQVQSELGAHDLSVSLRQDDNEAFGNETTGQVAWGLEMTEAWRLRAGYGTAFKAPTFNDLYWPGSGNPDLKPERSRTAELGLRFSGEGVRSDMTVFRTDLEDMIDWAPPPGGGPWWIPQNVTEVRIRGIEWETGIHRGDWSAVLAFTHLDHENRETGQALARRPDDSLRLDLDRTLGRWSLGGTVLAQGRRYNDEAESDRIPGHALLNLRAGYAFSSQWALRATLDNALDHDYVKTRGSSGDYNEPGRAVFLSLHYQQ
ncbi:MAG: TonB-dependent receptor domain-containing protein [Ectothiorhodospira sp.]